MFLASPGVRPTGRKENVKANYVGRFLARIRFPTDLNDCWEWTGARHGRQEKKYGTLRYQGKMQQAHRVAYWLFRGPIPSGYSVCHHCDNPPCVNPHHLFIGTHLDNVQDCIRKGRLYPLNLLHRGYSSKGEKNGAAKLTAADVIAIRSRCAQGESARSVAKVYGLNHRTVNRIIKRITWRHV